MSLSHFLHQHKCGGFCIEMEYYFIFLQHEHWTRGIWSIQNLGKCFKIDIFFEMEGKAKMTLLSSSLLAYLLSLWCLTVSKQRQTAEPWQSMDYDTVLLEIGEFGRWQQITQAWLWVPAIFCGFHALLFSFTGGYAHSVLTKQIICCNSLGCMHICCLQLFTQNTRLIENYLIIFPIQFQW